MDSLPEVLAAAGATLPEWPERVPTDLPGLVSLTFEELTELLGDADSSVKTAVWALRKQGVACHNMSRNTPVIDGEEAVEMLLESSRLQVIRHRWVTYIMHADLRLARVECPDRTTRYLTTITRRFPYRSELPKLPAGARFLVVYGGTPVIFDGVRFPDVAEKTGLLLDEAPVADIVLFDQYTKSDRRFWSLRFDAELFPEAGRFTEQRFASSNPDSMGRAA